MHGNVGREIGIYMKERFAGSVERSTSFLAVLLIWLSYSSFIHVLYTPIPSIVIRALAFILIIVCLLPSLVVHNAEVALFGSPWPSPAIVFFTSWLRYVSIEHNLSAAAMFDLISPP
ncbi:hypothetical protein F5B22DRAFT_604151 [Xylaria bambusicola]|uniref:uncharacterized protein n=1 Tax=Xylaria bambusicola TaxID=326684 RepID=UPI002008488A|nr:uncharacterized protein F5B22DRAFT_604151 [Xylaria bambusicola]KAI0517320.1 hypothetical protein F5B22DRAFT_604151 [Xylaria bambusicola]